MRVPTTRYYVLVIRVRSGTMAINPRYIFGSRTARMNTRIGAMTTTGMRARTRARAGRGDDGPRAAAIAEGHLGTCRATGANWQALLVQVLRYWRAGGGTRAAYISLLSHACRI